MNLFGDSDYLEKLSLKGDPLERLEKVVDFECFRPTLNRIFKYDLKNKSHGGRPPYDLVLMLKILILQRLYNLSDDAMEYQMIDRISFRRFLKIDDKGAELFTCLKNTRCKSLKADDKMFNKIISKIRVRIEHVFGFVENSMHGSSLRSIGFDRAVLNTDLTNLTYNLLRYEQVKRLNLKTWR